MNPATYYRNQAIRIRGLAQRVHQPDLIEQLTRTARDYDDIAEDLEIGAIEIRHPELLPQRRSEPG